MQLNRVVNDEQKILVILTNPMTPLQKKVTMKRFEVRPAMLNALADHYYSHHASYTKTSAGTYQVDRIRGLSSNPSEQLNEVVMFHTIRDHRASETIDADQDSVRRPKFMDSVTCEEDERLVHLDGSIFVNHQASTTIEALYIASAKIIDVERMGRLLPDSTPDILARLFQDLFPYGIGHTGTERPVKVSFHESCSHYIRLSKRLFAQHPTFPLISFDMCSRKKALMSIVISCQMNPRNNLRIASVTREELALQLKETTVKHTRMQNGTFSGHRSRSSLPSNVLLRSISAAAGKSYGTNEERRTYQRKAWNFAAKYHGAAVFVTLTPNENGSATVSYYSGDIDVDLLSEISLRDIPNNAKRIEISGKDPYACDLYFTNLIELFLQTILGFDLKTSRSFVDGGLFGIVKGFVGAIENQAKKTLHVHLIVYPAGLPRTCAEIDSLCASEDFRVRLSKFVDSMSSHSSPADGTKEPCDNCETKGAVKPTQLKSNAYRRPLRNASPPTTAICTEFGARYGSDVILRSYVRRLHNKLSRSGFADKLVPLHDDDYESDRLTEQYAALPVIPDIPKPNSTDSEKEIHMLHLVRLILLFQRHNWRHSHSCFKSSTNAPRGECRYNIPRPTVAISHVSATDSKILCSKYVGNEYINQYNDILLQVFRSNHDLRLTVGAADEIYYALKYSVKYQNDTDNIATPSLAAYDKRLQREESIAMDELQDGKLKIAIGRIASMAFARTAKQEVGSPMAVHYILHQSCFICFQSFSPLPLFSFLNKLENSEEAVNLVPSSGNLFRARSATEDYEYRPLQLSKLNLYEFIEQYSIGERNNGSREAEQPRLELLPGHSKHRSHIVRRRKVPVIADILGPRLPDSLLLSSGVDK